MNAKPSLRICVCVLGALLAFSARAAENISIDDLPHKTLPLPDGTKVTVVEYAGRNWRLVEASVLQDTAMAGQEVCFEAKYDSLIQPDKVKLFGLPGTIVIEDRLRFKDTGTKVKRTDNIAFFGELRRAKDGKSVEMVNQHMLKQVEDVPRYQNRIAALEKKNEYEALIELGHKIEQVRTGNIQGDFEIFQKLENLRDKAWDVGLTLKENSLKRDDADGFFALGQQWKDLRKKHAKYRAMLERCLKIDPDHPRAKQLAPTELGLQLFEGVWRRKEDVDKIVATRKADQERLDAAQKAEIEAKQRELEKAIAERPMKLIKHQSAMRAVDAAARQAAIVEFGDVIGKSPDPGFGRPAIDVLANLSDAAAVAQGLALAAKSELPDVRREVYDALAWRGRQQDQASLDTMAQALTAEKDSETTHSAIDALVALGGKPAAATLVSSLTAADRGVREEIIEGLKLVTKQGYTSPEAWQDWWKKNKDTFSAQ
jgi:hypothetical protein